jgi:hypothetical protein
MKRYVIREATNFFYNLDLIEAETAREALEKYRDKFPTVYGGYPIEPHRGTLAIKYGPFHGCALEAWEHFEL